MTNAVEVQAATIGTNGTYENGVLTITSGTYNSSNPIKNIDEAKTATKIVVTGDSTFHSTFQGNCMNMFSGLTSVEEIEIQSGVTCSGITHLNLFFGGCTNLKKVDMSGMNGKIGNAVFAGSMFSNCSSLTDFTLPQGLIVKNVSSMFRNCSSLTDVDLSTLTYQKNGDQFVMEYMFMDCISLKKVKLFTFNATNNASMFSGCSNLEEVDFGDYSKLDRLSNTLFENCKSLKFVNFGQAGSYVEGDKWYKDCIDTIQKIKICSAGAVLVPSLDPNYYGWYIEGTDNCVVEYGAKTPDDQITQAGTFVRVGKPIAETYKAIDGTNIGWCLDTKNGEVYIIYHPSKSDVDETAITDKKYNRIELKNKSGSIVDVSALSNGGVVDGELRTLYTAVHFSDNSELSAATADANYILAVKLNNANYKAPSSSVSFTLVPNETN